MFKELSVSRAVDSGTHSLIVIPSPVITERRSVIRPDGYRLHRYSAESVGVEADGISATGFGEGPGEIAFAKAQSEAIERYALNYFRRETGMSETSNGWAAHPFTAHAVDSAVFELIERDVALNAWENGGEFLELPHDLFPTDVREWVNNQQTQLEYSQLKILISHSRNGACVSALLFNSDGNFVVGHASAALLDHAITSSFNECLRAAHLAVRFEYLPEVLALHSDEVCTLKIRPGAHALAYAYGRPIPDEVCIRPGSREEIVSIWNGHLANVADARANDLEITLFKVGTHAVARAKSDRYRQIAWGKSLHINSRNQHPHFVG